MLHGFSLIADCCRHYADADISLFFFLMLMLFLRRRRHYLLPRCCSLLFSYAAV